MTKTTSPSGLPTTAKILTNNGWKAVGDLATGEALAHPNATPSSVDVVGLDRAPMVRLTLADRTTLEGSSEQYLRIRVGDDEPVNITLGEVVEMLEGGQRPRLVRPEPFHFGDPVDGPATPYLLGALLGDGYLRGGTPQMCNEDASMRVLIQAELGPDLELSPMKVGQAGTGSYSITSPLPGQNPLADHLRELGVNDKRAWEKTIPVTYLTADLPSRLALLQGLMDTDGSIDKLGRMEFSSSSRNLTLGVLHLIHGLGGRATYAVRTSITFTSPRQATPKGARDAHRLTNIRLPESITPFRRAAKDERMVYGRRAKQWTVQAAETGRPRQVVQIAVSAVDGLLIGEAGAFWVAPQRE